MKVDNKKPVLILPDSLSTRIFFSGEMVKLLNDAAPNGIRVLTTFDVDSIFDCRQWLPEGYELELVSERTLMAAVDCGAWSKFRLALDSWLDKHIGFFPLAVRFNLIHAFNLERMKRGHRNAFLDIKQGGLFPRSKWLFRRMFKWFYGPSRYMHPAIEAFMKENVSVLLTSNLQLREVQKYLIIAERNNIPVVGNIGSWDHPVGKGVVFPSAEKYLVQNPFMTDILQRYHGIDRARIVVTGWPQTDHYSGRRDRTEFHALLDSYGLDRKKPCILMAGNSEGNAPYEPAFLDRFVKWWEETGECKKYSIIFRPHPRDIIGDNWKKRFASLMNRKGLYVQSANYADIDVLSLMLAHVDCVVTNAGTILLDSLVNDRPVVCVLYDEGGPTGSRFALNNISGEHYRDLRASGAYHRADRFEDVIEGVGKCLADPSGLAEQRSSICAKIIGEVDGRAAARIVEAMLSVVS